MSVNRKHHLSKVARFDDLYRKQLPFLNGIDREWLKYLEENLELRKRLRHGSTVNANLQKELNHVTNARRTLEITLAQVRHELEEEMLDRKRLEMDNQQLARQLQLIKELVTNKNNQSYNLLTEEDRKKLDFLNHSTQYGDDSPSLMDTALLEDDSIPLSDAEIDKTGEDVLSRSRRRRSKRKTRSYTKPQHVLTPAQQTETTPRVNFETIERYPVKPSAPTESSDTQDTTPPKRRCYREGDINTRDTLVVETDTDDDLRSTEKQRKTRRSTRIAGRMRRSLSVGDPIEKSSTDTDSFFGLDTGHRVSNQPRSILKHGQQRDVSPSPSLESPTIKRWASAGRIRQHNLTQKNVIKPETCQPCGRKIKFGRTAYKCKDCKASCHLECKDMLSQVCLPIDTTPTKGTQGQFISDFAPLDPPYVPAILLKCVNEVESRGFEEEGIYRKSGSDREVKELKERFISGKDPKLSTILDIHVVCGVLKDFLRSLKEPLIPTALWQMFVDSVNVQDERRRMDALKSVVMNLAPTNRDSLAFLVIHLQRVSERPDTRMTIENLSKVFGVTIVGYSVPEPEPMQMIAETKQQQMVMQGFLELSTDYWTEILSGSNSSNCQSNLDTPDSKPPHRDQKSTAKVKQFFGESPRYHAPSSKKNKMFFPSPMLK